ncbi:response regulator [Candidatus Margulisiibacteriota bacterium]
MSGLDKNKFLAIFKAEADERIAVLEKGLLDLEKNPKNLEIIKRLNREAHSLKGAARMLGFEIIQQAAHRIEDVFSAIAKQEQEFTSQTADHIFNDLDVIKKDLLGPDAGTQKKEASTKVEYVRIPIHRVDKLMNLAGEMVVNKVKTSYKLIALKKINTLLREHIRILSGIHRRMGVSEAYQLELDTEKLVDEIRSLGENISAEALHLDPLIEELQDEVRNMRMLPAASTFDAYPRLVRDIAKLQKKEIEFIIIGGETEIDKKILEEVNSAIIHILRNSIDHGIEKAGKITLSAHHKGGTVLIQIADDGRGIDVEKIKKNALEKKLVTKQELEQLSGTEVINLIFTPGFSTASEVTDVSGRGIGMDVVKEQIERLRGQIEIESIKGAGTVVALKLPLTVALLQALMVKVAGQVFALPMLSVDEVIKVNPNEVSTIDQHSAIELRGHIVPLVKLADVLGLPHKRQWQHKRKEEDVHIIIASAPGKKVGFIVDCVIGDEEIYIKATGGNLGKLKNVEGATIMGTGEIIIVLDLLSVVENSKYVQYDAKKNLAGRQLRQKKVLIVEDALTTRELERSILETQGYKVVTAIDGLDALGKIHKEKPDIVIADINMPRMDGFEMCRIIKNDDKIKNIPVLMVTALEREEDLRRGLTVGADAYISKGKFNQQNLLEMIERHVG